jgi:hypothetical protein
MFTKLVLTFLSPSTCHEKAKLRRSHTENLPEMRVVATPSQRCAIRKSFSIFVATFAQQAGWPGNEIHVSMYSGAVSA